MNASLSFEFFSPKTDKSFVRMRECYQLAHTYKADFLSLTLHAGGKSAADQLPVYYQRSLKLLQDDPELPIAAHVSCVGKSRATVINWLDGWWQTGIRKFVVLRGDNPGLARGFAPHPHGFKSSLELIEFIRNRYNSAVTIYVACYPEVHPDAASQQADIQYLNDKFSAGADIAITQFFFTADLYFRFLDALVAAGGQQQIIPGILPIYNIKRTLELATACGATVPQAIADALTSRLDDGEAYRKAAADFCVQLCADLLAQGVKSFHFYTLNSPGILRTVISDLQLAPVPTNKDSFYSEKPL